MITLGIEGTAHTISCGIVDEKRILANASSTYHNPNGGIHPREAAEHHAEKVAGVISRAFEIAGVSPNDIDIVAYSKGPGLGPCLRIAATAARTLSVRTGKPLVGVNHPLGHVEIGRKLTGAQDPMLLYVSGGNTQIIAHINGRYRVLGETMDIGLGNLLDKIGRDLGYPFPGGPHIERLAKSGSKLLDLPYSVKGMDTSFSGIYTSAKRYIDSGEKPEDVSMSLQEYSFAMLVEVLERGLYQTDKEEILLAGGVARNQRLRQMISDLARDIGVRAYLTDSEYCMDNGAMIAQAGMLMYSYGYSTEITDSTVDQRFRIDQVEAPWIRHTGGIIRKDMGAESRIRMGEYLGRKAVYKYRIYKAYRHAILDENIRKQRLKNEATNMLHLPSIGVRAPVLFDIDPSTGLIILEKISGILLREYLVTRDQVISTIDKIARATATMHSSGFSHGDLTAGNIIIGQDEEPYFIDASLGRMDARTEDMATDLYLFMESIRVYRTDSDVLFREFIKEYSSAMDRHKEVLESFRELEKRRRYV